MDRWSTLAMLMLSFAPPATAAGMRERPNVVVILADDQGWGDLSLDGNPNVRFDRCCHQ